MYSGYRVMAQSRTGPKFGHPTLFLFLVYFSFTSPFYWISTMHLQLVPRLTQRWHQISLPPPIMGWAPLPMMVRKGVKNMKRKPILVQSLVVSTHAIPNVFKNVPVLFSSFQQSIKYYYHCSDIRNAYVNDMLPIFISAINGNGVW